MKQSIGLIVLGLAALSAGCGKDAATTFGSGNVPNVTSALTSSLPAGFKTGGAVASSLMSTFQSVQGLTGIDFNQAIGGTTYTPFPNTGSVLWLVWDLQYASGTSDFAATAATLPCSATDISGGSCFKIHPSTSVDLWNYYKRPASIATPDICRTKDGVTTATAGGSVVGKACLFEYTLMSHGADIDKCVASAGSAIDISKAIPWASSWGLPDSTKLKVQGSFLDGNNISWYGVNKTVTGNTGQYMLTQKATSTSGSNVYAPSVETVYLDRTTNQFFHYATSSIAGNQQGFMAYTGNLSATEGAAGTGAFEAIQVLEYLTGTNEKFTTRLRSNGTYIWMQSWLFRPGDAGFNVSTPLSQNANKDWCMKLSADLPNSVYVDESECWTAFGKTSRAAMNDDSLYQLKLGSITSAQLDAAVSGTQYTTANQLTATTGVCYP
ncbi:hypothetical protein WDW37_09050 [Bdellovibrionota bacterium FG-1]